MKATKPKPNIFDGQWHIAAVMVKDNRYKLYVDGIMVKSKNLKQKIKK